MNPQSPRPNEDEEIDLEAIQAASDETPTELTPSELSAQTKDLTKWDELPSASGMVAHKVTPEDDVSVAEQLVDEGADEADRQQRLAAADPDFEP